MFLMKALLLHVGLSQKEKNIFLFDRVSAKDIVLSLYLDENTLVTLHDFHRKNFVFTYFIQIIVVYRVK